MTRLLSLDGGVSANGEVRTPADLDALVALCAQHDALIPRGAGLSYAGASFSASATSLSAARFTAIEDFDPITGEVTVGAGLTLGALHAFLGPRGFYLPIQPGYGSITVGGCVAADVHGKNPARDGTFRAQVRGLRLFHPDHGALDLSATSLPEIFDLTLGGFGLTGFILTARLRAERLPGAWVETKAYPARDGAEIGHLLVQQAHDADFTYAWLDCARPASAGFGRGFVTALRFGGDVGQDAIDLAFPLGRLTPEWRARLPLSLMRRPTVMAMNLVYRVTTRAQGRGPMGKALFTFNGNEFYHALFGRPGFRECQVIVPDSAFTAYLDAIRALSRRHGAVITLAAGKRFAGQPYGLSFDGHGICLALNLAAGRATEAFQADLDREMLTLGGRPNLIKDSRLPRAVFDASVPEADAFRATLRHWDPRRRFRSTLSERLGL